MSDAFRGWPAQCQRFFIGLELDNSKRYFEANRKVYETAVKGPMVALVASLEDEFGPGKVFRANRDVRFSKDKSPYKTNIAATCGMGARGGYVSLDARGLTVATGRYELAPNELVKYRQKVAAPTSGVQLAGITAKLERSGFELGGEDLKRVPAGWPQDHPRARLLRHKRLYAWKNFGMQPWLGTPAARRHITKAWSDCEPLTEWFAKYLD
jgi:uncharacterized protein (TIGR02453 family)